MLAFAAMSRICFVPMNATYRASWLSATMYLHIQKGITPSHQDKYIEAICSLIGFPVAYITCGQPQAETTATATVH